MWVLSCARHKSDSGEGVSKRIEGWWRAGSDSQCVSLITSLAGRQFCVVCTVSCVPSRHTSVRASCVCKCLCVTVYVFNQVKTMRDRSKPAPSRDETSNREREEEHEKCEKTGNRVG